MSNRNPFEIRTELLELAQQYLQKQWEANLQFSKQAYEKMLEANQTNLENWQQYAPKFYSFEDIISKAKELYGFVNETR